MKIASSIKTIYTLGTQLRLLYMQFVRVRNMDLLNNDDLFFRETGQKLGNSIASSLSNLIFLKSESIIEEYERFFTHAHCPKYSKEILQLKIDIKPALKKIKRWKDSKLYRNTLIAHTLRLKNHRSIFELDHKIQINAPHYDIDYTIIYFTHLYMSNCIVKNFPLIVESIKSEPLLTHINFCGEKYDLKKELIEIKEFADNKGIKIEELDNQLSFLFKSNS